MMITTRSSWLAAWWFLWLHHPLWLQRRQETFSFPSNPGSGQRHQQQGGDGRGKAVAGLHHKAGHEIDLVLMFLFLQGKTSSMSLESPGCTSCRFWFDLNSFGHFLQECLFPFGVAYALQKDSPYTQRLLTYICIVSSSSIPNFVTSMLSSSHIIWRFSSKIQQLKESGLINLWIRQEQDLVGQRAEEGLNVTLSQSDIYIKILQTISCFWKVQAVVGYLLSPSITCSLFLWLASSTLKFIWNSIIWSNGTIHHLK